MKLHRYSVPGDVMLAITVRLNEAFEGIRLGALATAEGNDQAEVIALSYVQSRLTDIYEALLAVVSEQLGEREHGSDRPC